MSIRKFSGYAGNYSVKIERKKEKIKSNFVAIFFQGRRKGIVCEQVDSSENGWSRLRKGR